MPGSSSCVRCRQPLAVESASGLCDACSKALETSRPQGTPPVHNDDRTRSQLEGSNAATLTAGFDVDHPTATWTGPPRMPPSPAGYDLFRPLGIGGMGDVYLAREHAAERTLAIKFLRHACNPVLRDRFLNEVRALGRIDHPHVVRIISVDLDRSDPFYTMEYGAGGTIADRIKSEGPYEPEAAARICIRLADALAAVHEAEIFHRDIKPSNVILTADGTPKLSDFGLAKLRDAHDELTRTTQAVGTPAYMPPEQISRKFGEFGPATDVYGLGATLYSMLTGKAPFEGDSNEDVITKVRSDDPVRRRSLRPDLAPGLEAIVLKCLEKRPADRYASSDELARDLELCLVGKRPVAPALTRLRRVRKWAGRNRLVLVASAAVAALIIRGILVPQPDSKSSLPNPRPEVQKELEEKKRVEVLNEKGIPKSFAWRLGTVVLEESDNGVGGFQTQWLSMLDLVPEIRLRRYRLSLDILHFIGQGNGGLSAGPDRVGIYFGAAESKAAGTRCLSQFIIRFKDIRVPPRPDGQQLSPRIELLPMALIVRDTKLPDFYPGEAASYPLQSSPVWPGAWRRIVVDVTPESVQAAWQNEAGEMQPFFPAGDNAALVAKQYLSPQSWLDRGLNPAPRIPEWDAAAAFGIFAQESTVKFRNVILESLPNP